MAATGFKKYAVWDTEMNYGNMRHGSQPVAQEEVQPVAGAAYLAQTYLFR